MQPAQITNPIVPKFTGQQPVAQFSSIMATIIFVLLVGGVLIFVIYFLIGAIRWITSGGDKGQVESARNQVLHAVVGLIVLFSLFAILSLIQTLFKVDVLNIDVGRVKL